MTGTSLDWAMGAAGILLTYGFELPEGGELRFNPPVSYIDPVGFETFQAFKVIGNYVATKYGKGNSTASNKDGNSA